MSETPTLAERLDDQMPFVWDDARGNGILFAEGHIEPSLFIRAARKWWSDTTGSDECWEDHYGEMEPEYVEHLWWWLDPATGLTWDDDLEDVPLTVLTEFRENARPYTRYCP